MKHNIVSHKGMIVMRMICIGIGIIMIILGIYFKMCPYVLYEGIEEECGEIAMIVECYDEEQLKAAAKLEQRVTVAIPLERLMEGEWGSFALRHGMEVIAMEPKEEAASALFTNSVGINWRAVRDMGARGMLLHSTNWDEYKMNMTHENYVISRGEVNGTLEADYFLDGTDEGACSAAVSAVIQDITAGKKAILLYSPGEDMPLEETFSRLENMRMVLVSGILE